MVLTIIVGLAFALAFFFFTSSSFTAMRYAGAYPFAMIVFGLLFIYLFVAASSDILKWVNGILFLVCGFACMQDVEKIRRKHKSQKDEEAQPESETALSEQKQPVQQSKIDEASDTKADADTDNQKKDLGLQKENS